MRLFWGGDEEGAATLREKVKMNGPYWLYLLTEDQLIIDSDEELELAKKYLRRSRELEESPFIHDGERKPILIANRAAVERSVLERVVYAAPLASVSLYRPVGFSESEQSRIDDDETLQEIAGSLSVPAMKRFLLEYEKYRGQTDNHWAMDGSDRFPRWAAHLYDNPIDERYQQLFERPEDAKQLWGTMRQVFDTVSLRGCLPCTIKGNADNLFVIEHLNAMSSGNRQQWFRGLTPENTKISDASALARSRQDVIRFVQDRLHFFFRVRIGTATYHLMAKVPVANLTSAGALHFGLAE